jgi:hypothetical protein
VPFDVPKSLLGDAKKTDGHILRNTVRNIFLRKVYVYPLLFLELLAEALHARYQSESLQRRRMQAV